MYVHSILFKKEFGLHTIKPNGYWKKYDFKKGVNGT